MSEIQSLARGLHILNLAIDAGRSISITEIAAKLQIDKSSASRLVKTLVKFGYLQLEPSGRRYTPGTRLYQVGWQLMNMLPLRGRARPYLKQLVAQTGECSHIAVYAENKALVIDDVETENSLRVAGNTGRMIPLHCTAVGKGMLAFSKEMIHLLPSDLPPYTPRTITDPALLREHLEQICAQGYALDDEEHEPGIRCIAAPVYNPAGIVIASIGISGPSVRVTPERITGFAVQVMRAANELSAELGYLTDHKEMSKVNGKNL